MHHVPYLAIALLCSSLGSASAQWVPGGAPVCTVPGGKFGICMTSDGEGGAYIAWSDFRAAVSFDPDIFMQHLRSDGTIDPGWPEEGLPICTAPGAQSPAELISDGQGGVFLGWLDYRDPPSDSARVYRVFAQHITPNGIAAGWPQDGRSICPTSCALDWLRLSEDASGGAYLTWLSKIAPPPWSYGDHAALKVARIDASGEPVPGWPAAGIAVGDTVTPHHFRMTLPDGAGGLYLVSDRSSRSYLYHIGPDGSTVAGWPETGLDVSQRSSFGS